MLFSCPGITALKHNASTSMLNCGDGVLWQTVVLYMCLLGQRDHTDVARFQSFMRSVLPMVFLVTVIPTFFRPLRLRLRSFHVVSAHEVQMEGNWWYLIFLSFLAKQHQGMAPSHQASRWWSCAGWQSCPWRPFASSSVFSVVVERLEWWHWFCGQGICVIYWF